MSSKETTDDCPVCSSAVRLGAPCHREDCPERAPAYTWACETCRDEGWIDQRAGGDARSGWAECPDCRNPHGGTHP